ncbi:hypothetical protein VCR12J2_620070 [Vibrio coralliirubri]|nr:hypothetical protein VCR12J2_620070 [Vibrio coralliirubri]
MFLWVFNSVFIFRYGLASRYPESVNHPWHPEEEGQDDVNQQIFTCATSEEHTNRRKQYT